MINELGKGPGIEFEAGNKANCLLYADDIAIIGKDVADINTLLNICQGVAERWHFKFNITKCAFIGPTFENVRLAGEKLEKVEVFSYLGIRFNENGLDTETHIKEMKQKMSRTTQFFNGIGWNGGGYRVGTKVAIYKSFIRPKMEYGLAIMSINKKCMKVMESAQYESLCSMWSVSKKSSYKTIQLLTGLPSMGIRVGLLKSKWNHRYEFVKEDDLMLLPKIENWNLKHGIVTVMNQVLLNSTIQSEELSEKGCIKKFSKEYFDTLKRNIPIFLSTPLIEIDVSKLQNLLKGKVGNKNDLHTISLFILNKYPAKPEPCGKCGVKLSKKHLVSCNMDIWKEKIDELKNHQLLKSVSFSVRDLLELPYRLLKVVTKIANSVGKDMLISGLAYCLKTSLVNCLSNQQ